MPTEARQISEMYESGWMKDNKGKWGLQLIEEC